MAFLRTSGRSEITNSNFLTSDRYDDLRIADKMILQDAELIDDVWCTFTSSRCLQHADQKVLAIFAGESIRKLLRASRHLAFQLADGLSEATARIESHALNLLDRPQTIDPRGQAKRPFGFRLALLHWKIRCMEYLHLQLRDFWQGWKATADQVGSHIYRRQQPAHVALEPLQGHLLVGHSGGEQHDLSVIRTDLHLLFSDNVAQHADTQLLKPSLDRHLIIWRYKPHHMANSFPYVARIVGSTAACRLRIDTNFCQ